MTPTVSAGETEPDVSTRWLPQRQKEDSGRKKIVQARRAFAKFAVRFPIPGGRYGSKERRIAHKNHSRFGRRENDTVPPPAGLQKGTAWLPVSRMSLQFCGRFDCDAP